MASIMPSKLTSPRLIVTTEPLLTVYVLLLPMIIPKVSASAEAPTAAEVSSAIITAAVAAACPSAAEAHKDGTAPEHRANDSTDANNRLALILFSFYDIFGLLPPVTDLFAFNSQKNAEKCKTNYSIK